jgi:holo-ACP synthase
MSAARSVTLEAMLAARDARVVRQNEALAAHNLPLISVTLVTPGPVKSGMRPHRLMQAALAAIDASLSRERWPAIVRQVFWLPTGPEALYVVNADSHALKTALIELENRHALGRLWDLDVITRDGSVGRGQLGIAPRRCLICDEAAHACSRSRRHSLPELIARIENMVDAFDRHDSAA